MTSNSSLLQWLATFELDGQPSVGLKDDAYYNLADGYVCARILNQISPQYFSDKWLDGIKPVPPNGSWRLRVSNLKRILQKVHDYASDLQSPQFRPSAITPDVAVIAQNFDPDQISRLIQLILFCAINCDKKEDYIEKIRNFPTQIKQDIKEAIEELLIKNHDSSYNQKLSTSHLGNDSVNLENEVDQSTCSNQSKILSPARSTGSRSFLRRDSSQSDTSRHNESHFSNYQNETVDELKHRLGNVVALKEEKAQACHELEIRLKQLQLEKEQLVFENEKLSRENRSIVPSDSRRSQEAVNSSKVENREKDARLSDLELENKRLQGLLQQMKEDLIRIETEKEDYRLKSNLLREDIDKISSKHEEFKTRAEQAKRLQDELDEHRHISEKVANYETTIENLVKKNNDLKKELKNIEEKNVSHIQRIVRLEEDNSQLTDAVNRAEIFRKQLREAQVKLTEETHRADKGEVELARLSEKYSSIKRENEKLYETTNRLIRSSRDSNQESGKLGQAIIDNNVDDESGDRPNSTLAPTLELKERVARLEYENELLQNKLKVKREEEHTVLGGLLESANSRCTKLEIENRQARKKILMLEGHLRDLFNSSSQNGASTSNAVAAALNNENSSSDNTLALMNRVEELQRLLFQKEQELMESETKYKRNLQKAKDVMKNLNNSQTTINNSLQLSCISSASSYNSNSLDETNMLKQQLKDREEQLIDLEREFSEFKKLKEVHERLFISAFYGVTTQMQWRNAEKRLERTTLTSPPNTASPSMNHSKHSH